MIRKVAAHIQTPDGDWVVHLRCGHKLFTAFEDHARNVKGRFCVSCPGAEKALMADQRNEIEHRMKKVVEASRPLAELLKNYGKDPA
jgi:hypothetical protein